MIEQIIQGKSLEEEIQKILSSIHSFGPVDGAVLEKLALIKKYHPNVLEKYESKILSAMGLFYKLRKPDSLFERVYSIFSDTIEDETGRRFTPVQASAYKAISSKVYFSFSAPTSSGKSFLFREIIKDATGDIVIVVPSRALIAEYYNEVIQHVDKRVLVLQFIENVNRKKTDRRIFIITPERGVELFKKISELNIELFLFDEAQISEEEIRGMRFDSFVRRVDKNLPQAKKVFAHPFVNNPGAQLLKHNFLVNSSAFAYTQHSVGKIFVTTNDKKQFHYFSPNVETRQVLVEENFIEDRLNNGGTLLVYISKDKLYKNKHLIEFDRYIGLCKKLTDPRALSLIDELRKFIGASKTDISKHSTLIEFMEFGIVIHHGSVPLKARLIIEQFIKSNFAKICFATSTLNQGINMPFDIVWIDNFHRMTVLNLKNLIGRSGRSTKGDEFDYGYTVIRNRNVKTFKNRFRESVKISAESSLDKDISQISPDVQDVVEALKDESFNDELHLTEKQVQRLNSSDLDKDIVYILDNLLYEGLPITGKRYYELKKSTKDKIKKSFKNIFIRHLRRNELTKSEQAILSTAIPIILWQVQGKSFSEMVSLRHAFLSEKDKMRNILQKLAKKEISVKEAKKQQGEIFVRYSPIASQIPNKSVRAPSLFTNTLVDSIDYDRIVYDTYDYLDKVISLSIADPICAAFQLYYNKTQDQRALNLINYIRYGTNDDVEIWLLKYGFSFEEIEWLKEFVVHIDEDEIKFSEDIYMQIPERVDLVRRYL